MSFSHSSLVNAAATISTTAARLVFCADTDPTHETVMASFSQWSAIDLLSMALQSSKLSKRQIQMYKIIIPNLCSQNKQTTRQNE
jgi:hypothetical protein